MTKEELYIRLLTLDPSSAIPDFKSEFLRGYEITKLILSKFMMRQLKEEHQRHLNKEALSIWLGSASSIHLRYDIPEILELMPEKIVGLLDLNYSKVKCLPQVKSVGGSLEIEKSETQSLPALESVGGSLRLVDSQIQSLPKLESVAGHLDLRDSKIQSLPKLKSVGGSLIVGNSKIQSLPKLKAAGGNLYLQNSKIQTLPELDFVGRIVHIDKHKVDYWKNYFREIGRPHLAKKIQFR